MLSSNSRVENSFDYPENDSINGEDNSDNSYLKRRNYDGSLQNGQLTNFYFKKSKEIQISLSIIVIINIYFIIVVNQLSFPQLKSTNESTLNICLYFSILCVLIAIVLLSMRSFNLLKLEKEQKKIYKKQTIYSTNKILYLLCQWIILLIQPYPFFTGIYITTWNSFENYTIQYPLNDLLSIFSFARVYIILRSSLLITPYMNNRSQRLCKMYGCQVDYSYSLKCLFKEHPLKLICIMYSITALIFAYLVYLAERQLANQSTNSSDKSTQFAAIKYSNALWLILITTTTVGYGDYFPKTPLGRIIIVFVAIWGTLIVSIMVVVVSNTLNMQKNEVRTSKILNKLQLRREMQQKATKFIGCFMMLYFSRKRKINKKTMITKLMRSKKQFTELKRSVREITYFDDLEDQIATHFLKLNNDIDVLNRNQDKIIEYMHDKFNKSAFDKRAQYNKDDGQQLIVRDRSQTSSDSDTQNDGQFWQLVQQKNKVKLE